MRKLKVGIVLIFLISFIMVGCVGMARTANPVQAYQYGDEQLSCEGLKYEIAKCDAEVARLTSTRNSKTGANVALGVVGAVVFWPALLAMDFSGVEKEELNAYRNRHDQLTRIAIQKKCSLTDTAPDLKEETLKTAGYSGNNLESETNLYHTEAVETDNNDTMTKAERERLKTTDLPKYSPEHK